MDGIALNLTMVFLFFRISFLHEFIASKLHVDLHILMLLGGLSLLTAFLGGRLTVALKNRSAIYWFLYALCLCVATLGSTWRGGSLPILMDFLRTTLPLLLLIPAVVVTTADLLKVMKAMGWAGIATVALGFSTKELHGGRLVLKDAPSIGNSNDYAAYLIFVFPFIAYLVFAHGRQILQKIMGLVVLPAGLFQLLSTGSRGGLVGITAMLLGVVVIGKPKVKAAILIGVPLFGLIALPLVPSRPMERLQSLFQDSHKDTEAAESSEARTMLLKESIRLTFAHPLFGVGPGEFLDSENKEAQAQGRKGMWHETHNTYTQVSSECGIPAFIFFIAAIGTTFALLWKLKKNADPALSGVARVVLVSMFGFAVSAFFLSHAYDFPLLVSCSLAITLSRLAPRAEGVTA